MFWGEIPGVVTNWQKALEARWSGPPQLPAGVCLSPAPIHLRFIPKVGKHVGHWLLLGFTWLTSPDSSSEMLHKPCQRQLLGYPRDQLLLSRLCVAFGILWPRCGEVLWVCSAAVALLVCLQAG